MRGGSCVLQSSCSQQRYGAAGRLFQHVRAGGTHSPVLHWKVWWCFPARQQGRALDPVCWEMAGARTLQKAARGNNLVGVFLLPLAVLPRFHCSTSSGRVTKRAVSPEPSSPAQAPRLNGGKPPRTNPNQASNLPFSWHQEFHPASVS